MGKIFISYRRKDWAFAQRLAEHLDVLLPTSDIFIDIKIEEADFVKVILREIRECDFFILVVTERTFEQSRINEDRDWIRREIKEALDNNKYILLVGVEDCIIPEGLPDDIERIRRFQAILFYPQYYSQGLDEIIKWCKRLLPEKFQIENELESIPAKPSTVQQTGIVTTYKNLDKSRDAMRSDFRESKNIRLLLQLGRKELGDGTSSMFYSEAISKASMYNTTIRILRASAHSPFLTKERAMVRNSQYIEWKRALEHLEQGIQLLKNHYHVNIEERTHGEPFLWRIFLFDDIAYVSGYLFKRRNDSQAVVHKIKKGDNSLFAVFDTYFEYLWKKYDPNDPSDANEKWVDWS